jgi:Regulator of chromosome condensation (RCC1) repeat
MLYSFGISACGALGLGMNVCLVREPTLVRALEHKQICHVQAGSSVSAAISSVGFRREEKRARERERQRRRRTEREREIVIETFAQVRERERECVCEFKRKEALDFKRVRERECVCMYVCER